MALAAVVVHISIAVIVDSIIVAGIDGDFNDIV